MNFNSLHVCLPIQIKSKADNNNAIPGAMLTANNFFFSHWLKEIDIKKYGDVLQILPVSYSTEVYKYSKAMLKYMSKNALKTFENTLLYFPIMFINFLDLLMVDQIFISPHVKRSMIISNKLVYTSCLTSCRTTSDLIFGLVLSPPL